MRFLSDLLKRVKICYLCAELCELRYNFERASTYPKKSRTQIKHRVLIMSGLILFQNYKVISILQRKDTVRFELNGKSEELQIDSNLRFAMGSS